MRSQMSNHVVDDSAFPDEPFKHSEPEGTPQDEKKEEGV